MKSMKRTLVILFALVMAFAFAACGGQPAEPASTEEGAAETEAETIPASEPITIKFQGAFTEGAADYYYFDRFCESVYERSGGTVTVVWGAGPEAIPADQLAEAMINGIVELVYTPYTYLVTVAPVFNGVKMMDPLTVRANGGTEYIDELSQQYVNSHFLARASVNCPYAIMTNKPIKTVADWKGMVVRGTAAHKPLLEAVGAEMVTMGWGEVYQAAEKNVVAGVGGTLKNFVDSSIGEVMEYLVDPGFYCSDSSLLLNNSVWDKLDDAQRQAIVDSAIDWESDSAAHFADDNEDMIRILEETGAQVNALVGADREEFLNIANDAAWKVVENADPEIAAKMREFAGN